MTKAVFAWESLGALRDDGIAEHVRAHWDEVGVHKEEMPLAVDWDRYHDLEEKGILRLVGARIEAELVGYSSFMVMPHLHYSTTLHALNDAVYVDMNHRGVGMPLIRASERMLAELARPSWVRIIYHAKFHVEQARGTLMPVFQALGYQPFESCLDKMVRAA